ncbi:MAG: transporter substrate-binding domain-containing protein [Parachlamydiales bacterium]
MKKVLFFLLLGFWALSCSSSNQGPLLRLGIDPSWQELEAGLLGRNLNAFLEEFLLQVCTEEKIRIELVKVSRSKLFPGLESGLYEAVLSTFYPYNFNLGRYAFSKPLLFTGSVLVLAQGSPPFHLDGLSGKLVGVMKELDTNFLIQQYPKVIYKEYSSAPELLDHLEDGFLDGAILENLQAIPFVKNLFSGHLTIVGPLSDMGIRLVCLKDQRAVLKIFKKHLKDKKSLNGLKAKWGLL